MAKRKIRSIGNIHLRDEAIQVEEVEVPPAMRELCQRRTEWVIRDYVAFDRPIRHAMMQAYLQGISDAADALDPD